MTGTSNGGLAPQETAPQDDSGANPAADDMNTGPTAVHDSGAGGKAAEGVAAGLASAGDLQREASGPSPHYDPSRDIVLRYEFLDSRAIKAIILAVWVIVLIDLVLLILAIYVSASLDSDWLLRHKSLPVINTVGASIMLLAMGSYWLYFSRRLLRAHRSTKVWTHRARRLMRMAYVELTVALANAIVFLIPNAYMLTESCAWFSDVVAWCSLVRWTMWNTLYMLYWIEAHGSNPATSGRWGRWAAAHPEVAAQVEGKMLAVVDAPFWMHWRKAWLWLIMEGVVVAGAVLTNRNSHRWTDVLMELDGPDCSGTTQLDCTKSTAMLTIVSLFFACCVCYSLAYVWTIYRTFQTLLKLPYNMMRRANLVVRIQVRMRALTIGFFMLSSICYTFIGINSCNGYVLSWLGYMPVILVFSGTALAHAYIMTPKRPNDTGIMQAWLQEFAWTEAELPQRLRERQSTLAHVDSSRHHGGQEDKEALMAELAKEPMFCFETALKAMYWSLLVYDYQEVEDSPFNLDDGLALYNLQFYELFWERVCDTKVLVAWGDDTVVVSFRGTASLSNVAIDSQVWRARWPEGIGSVLLATAPMVHWGFHKAWTTNGFGEELCTFVQQLVCDKEATHAGPQPPKRVLVTGHSLGGAMATLCAFSLARLLPPGSIQQAVYTFGAPRTGNHAFAAMYNDHVPDTWHIINADDVVTQGGKFFILYKRPGQRVLINKLGDMVVRPTFAETMIRRVPGGYSLTDHLMTSYQGALAAVLGTQFSPKSFAHGRAGVLRLARQAGAHVMLGAAGYASSAFDLLRQEGWDAFLRAQEAQRRVRRRLPWLRTKEEGAKHAASEGSTPGRGGEPAAAAAQSGAVEMGEAGPPRSEEEQVERQFLPQELEAIAGSMRRVLLRSATLDIHRYREMLRAFSSRGPLAFGKELVDFRELAVKQHEAAEEQAAAEGAPGR